MFKKDDRIKVVNIARGTNGQTGTVVWAHEFKTGEIAVVVTDDGLEWSYFADEIELINTDTDKSVTNG